MDDRPVLEDPGIKEKVFEVRLFYRPPFHWPGIIQFLQDRAVSGLEDVDAGAYRRRIRRNGKSGVIEVRPIPGESFLLLKGPSRLRAHQEEIAEQVRRLFDLETDPGAMEDHFRKDPILGDLVRAYPGLRVPGAWDGFEIAVRAIVGQQISVKAAGTMVGRLVERYGPVVGRGEGFGSGRLFPSPRRLAQAPMEEMGLIAARARTIRLLSEAVDQGRVVLEPGGELSRIVTQLTAFPGIGDWTANYIAMRACGQQDAFPAGDLVLRRIMADVGRPPLTEKQALVKARDWRPYRAYATIYLWTHCHGPAEK